MRMRTAEQTERAMLNGTREITEALYRHGAFSEEEIGEMVEIQKVAGAKPLRLKRAPEARESSDSLEPGEIRAIRQKANATQADLAWYLGVAPSTVGQWERGVRRPEGPAAKLLALVKANGLDYIR